MRVAVLQSNYVPWKGYFDLIHDCDTFVFYDDVQYTKNDWRNRNRIYTRNGLQWLTIPVAATRFASRSARSGCPMATGPNGTTRRSLSVTGAHRASHSSITSSDLSCSNDASSG